MNWTLVFKYLLIVLTPVVFISSVLAVAWFYLHQQRKYSDRTDDGCGCNKSCKRKNNSNKVSSNISSNENYNRTLKILDSKNNIDDIENKNISPTIKPAISQESSTINIETQDQINKSKKKLNQKIESKSINNGANMNKFVSSSKPYNNMAIDNDTRSQNMLKIINGPLDNTAVENNNNDNKTSQKTTLLTDVGNSIEKNNDNVHIDRIQQKLQQTLRSEAESIQISNNASVIMTSINNTLNKDPSQIYEQEKTLVRDSNMENTTTGIKKELNSLDQNNERKSLPAVNSNFENSTKKEDNELDIFETTTSSKNIDSDTFDSKQAIDSDLNKFSKLAGCFENFNKDNKSDALAINKSVNQTCSNKVGIVLTSNNKAGNSAVQNNELRKSPPALNNNFENSTKKEGIELDISETTTASKNIKSDGFNSKQIQDNNLNKLPMSDNNSENSTKVNKSEVLVINKTVNQTRSNKVGIILASSNKTGNSAIESNELRKSPPALTSNFEKSSKKEGYKLDISETTTSSSIKQTQYNNLNKLPRSASSFENSIKDNKSDAIVINKSVNQNHSTKIGKMLTSNNKTGNSAVQNNEKRKSTPVLNSNLKKTKKEGSELDISETTSSSNNIDNDAFIKQAQDNNLNKLSRSDSSFENSIKDNKSYPVVISKSVNQTRSNKVGIMSASNNKTGNSAIQSNELRKSLLALNTNIEKSTKNDRVELNTFETTTSSGNIESNTFVSSNALNSENLIKDNKSEALVIIPPVNHDNKVTLGSNRIQSNEIGVLTSNNNTDKSARIHDNKSELLVITPPTNNENSNDTFGSSNQTQSTKIRIQSTSKNGTKIITNDRVNETNNLIITTTITDDIRTTTPNTDQIDDENEAENELRCYSQLGCLNIRDSWYHLMHRPINVFPLSREFINTSFILYTKNNPIKGQVLTAGEDKSTKLSNFDPKRKTKFIIHGFNSSPRIPWVNEMRDELFKHDNYNIFIVDWATGSSLALSYTYAAANTRLVGLEIAHLIRYLNENNGLKMSDVHLIGHSLGAHTAGYAGEDLQGQVGRISGLDPAKPDFEYMPSHVRLDPTDARLVDVIHTDSESISRLGIYHPCGHLDFYPNNGGEQPGCSSSFFKTICDHVRAIKIFIESINSECQFIAHECRSYEKYLAGGCFPSASNNNSLGYGIMGYHADKSPALVQRLSMGQLANGSFIESKFFISTGDKNPYCRRHYRITITLAKPDEAKSRVQGLMNITLHTDNGIFYNINLTPNESRIILTHGGTTKILAIHPEADANVMGKIRKVDLSWTYNSDTFLLYCLFCNDRLYVDNIVVEVIRLLSDRGKRTTNVSSKFCSTQGPKTYTEIISGSSAAFVDNCH